jgi:hypothetical protein
MFVIMVSLGFFGSPHGIDPRSVSSAASPRVRYRCWLEDLNLLPLAYEASALPMSQASAANCQRGTRRRPRTGSDLRGAPRLGAASEMDIHNVEERGAGSAVVAGVGAHDPGTRACTCTAGAWIELRVLRLGLRVICPPASTAEGGPCAGYSGFRTESCPTRSIDLEELRYARAPTNRQSLGRSNPAVTALSAVARCDALNSIGVLSWRAESSSAGGVFD